MDDAKRSFFSTLTRLNAHRQQPHAKAHCGSEDSDATRFVARPHISLKARMLGGQAETIMRLGGLTR
jgi:hypothetical protein